MGPWEEEVGLLLLGAGRGGKQAGTRMKLEECKQSHWACTWLLYRTELWPARKGFFWLEDLELSGRVCWTTPKYLWNLIPGL